MEKVFVVTSSAGFHAALSSAIVNQAGKFKSYILIEVRGQTIDAKSIMGFMSYVIVKGDEMKVKVIGEDEEEAFKTFQNFLISEKIAVIK